MPAIEADDDRPVGEAPFEAYQIASVVRQQERRQSIADVRRRGAGAGHRDLVDESLVGCGKGLRMDFYRSGKQSEALTQGYVGGAYPLERGVERICFSHRAGLVKP